MQQCNFQLLCLVELLFSLILGYTHGGGTVKVQTFYNVRQPSSKLPDLYEATIAELQEGMVRGQFSSVDLVKAYFARIEEVNLAGPALRAVVELNPSALAQAAILDEERKIKGPRGPLHGIPIILKDNIATLASDGMNTTAGSFALLGSIPPRDATVVAKLRAAGAVVLGKANMSEWAQHRGAVPNGFSGRGGQANGPYYPMADPSGSSSGSAISSAIGLAAASLGTETDGSIVSPSSRNNVVGIKPTVGLTSRAGVIPISVHQDTIGPIARTVTDAAVILNIIAGQDPLDNFTAAAPEPVPDYTKALKKDGLKGVRLGIPRLFQGSDFNIISAFNKSLAIFKQLGATIVDGTEFPSAEEMFHSNNETIVLNTDFKVNIATYISGLTYVPTGVTDLADLIQFNINHTNLELVEPYWTSQSTFIQAENTTVDAAYFAALAFDYEMGRTQGIDATLKEFNLDALLLPTNVPLGFQPDAVNATPATPLVGNAPGLPYGIAFMGTAFSELQLIQYAYAYEQATHNRLKRLAYPAAIPSTQLVDVIELGY